MTDTFNIRPATAGATILDPANGDRLPDEGAIKPRTAYWIGLQMRGDVVEIEDEAPAEVPEPEAPTQARVAKRRSADA